MWLRLQAARGMREVSESFTVSFELWTATTDLDSSARDFVQDPDQSTITTVLDLRQKQYEILTVTSEDSVIRVITSTRHLTRWRTIRCSGSKELSDPRSNNQDQSIKMRYPSKRRLPTHRRHRDILKLLSAPIT